MIRRIFLPAVALLLTTGCSLSLIPQIRPATGVDRQRIDRVLEQNPDHPHAQFLRGRADLEQGESKRALEEFRRARALMPEFEEAWEGVGVALLDLGRVGEALSTYNEMAQRFPSSAAAYEGIATAELLRANLDAAEQNARKALELDERSAQGARLMGEIAYSRADYPAALEWWNAAAELNPSVAGDLRPIMNDLKQFVEKYPQD